MKDLSAAVSSDGKTDPPNRTEIGKASQPTDQVDMVPPVEPYCRTRMSKPDKLLHRALNNPAGLRFEEALYLANHYGFVTRKSKSGTSHIVLKHPGHPTLLNFQRDNGRAKPYQVRQLLEALRDLGVIND